LNDAAYAEFSRRLTTIGDGWRSFARSCAQACRQRGAQRLDFGAAAELARACGRDELALFRDLYRHEQTRS
jgi:hypothetical protein